MPHRTGKCCCRVARKHASVTSRTEKLGDIWRLIMDL
ncbi:rCG25361 [Rattus norvegicus]|uniref:RCG25361 n=1 Tax=Rattus norvegicus TaxID=10116 RepID=A6I1S5_RAT|nr:rCG25361 [Rattus norvegicus]